MAVWMGVGGSADASPQKMATTAMKTEIVRLSRGIPARYHRRGEVSEVKDRHVSVWRRYVGVNDTAI